MAIPAFRHDGELPPGEHETTLDEIEPRFGRASERRVQLFTGLVAAMVMFKRAGVPRLWLNGSFVTTKQEPNDIDGCWEYAATVDLSRLDPVFLARSRQPMKQKYGLDFFPAHVIEAGCGLPFPAFFQTNREGEPKGILVVRLGGAP